MMVLKSETLSILVLRFGLGTRDRYKEIVCISTDHDGGGCCFMEEQFPQVGHGVYNCSGILRGVRGLSGDSVYPMGILVGKDWEGLA